MLSFIRSARSKKYAFDRKGFLGHFFILHCAKVFLVHTIHSASKQHHYLYWRLGRYFLSWREKAGLLILYNCNCLYREVFLEQGKSKTATFGIEYSAEVLRSTSTEDHKKYFYISSLQKCFLRRRVKARLLLLH